MIVALLVNRIPVCSVAEIAVGGLAVREDGEGWQDKGPRCAARSVVCFPYDFDAVLRCSPAIGEVRDCHLVNLSNRNRTSRENGREQG
ncbi:hypothetical protein [Mesorhizobium sp. M0047]|uniref:hypothetical protein n=1 Tax=Mesorhizobium sp. M0047 TaxID=2956859 RepID=UPI00333CB03B